MKLQLRPKRLQRGSALVTTFMVMTLLALGAVMYVDFATQTMRESKRSTDDVMATNLCESGIQFKLRQIWRVFKEDQTFEEMDDVLDGATTTNPLAASYTPMGNGNGVFAVGVIAYTKPNSYNRVVKIRSLGFIDANGNEECDEGEVRKTIDVACVFSLSRSKVFDYTYFINNYGWWYGFTETTAIVNGDIRANGNMDFTGGTPVVNGSVVASMNSKLDPAAAGIINSQPVKWTNSAYAAAQAGSVGMPTRWRQAYSASSHGALGTTTFDSWRDLVFNSVASAESGRPFGATLDSVAGSKAWVKTSGSATPTETLLDNVQTSELVMPDLRDISRYQTLSQTYVDTKATYSDGTPNPNYGSGAKLEVWNSSLNQYVRVDTNGVVNGSAVLVGTDARPIKITGPVTVLQDVVIKGTVQGQGTLYTGRNVHVVGSIKYKTPPNFQGSNPTAIDQAAEKADVLALAARGSIFYGNPNSYQSNYPLYYMTPPFTKGRYNENGVYVPPYNAREVDSSGKMRYQSVVPDATINSISEGVNQIDAIMYTNNMGGGQLGVGGTGVTINGSLISKDEANIIYSLPLRMNYDNRIKERSATSKPLIDIELPRAPQLLRNTWQEWGMSRNADGVSVGGLQNGIGNGRGMRIKGPKKRLDVPTDLDGALTN